MGKIEDPQDTEGERKARGDQKKQGAPGDPTHELVEKNIKRHIPYQKGGGVVEYWNNGIMGKSQNILLLANIPVFHHSILPHFVFT